MPELKQGVDYEEMERVARAATPGPWENSLGSVNNWHDHTFEMEWVPNGQADDADGVNANYRADAEFIATFDPPTVLALLAERRELREALDRLGSMEAFETARVIDPHRDRELLARIDYARKALTQGEG